MIGKNTAILEFYKGIPRQNVSSLSQSSRFEPPTQETVWPTEEWQTSSPETQGIESQELADYVAMLAEPTFHVDSLLLVRNGYIVTEVYFHPYRHDIKHHTYSVTKSVISVLIGIAIGQGYIVDTDQPVLDFFPNITIANVDSRKSAITVEHLLTMTSGLACDWTFGTSVDDAMRASDDWVHFALNLPMIAEPGTEFHYCNANAHLLSAILTATTGMSALEFAYQKLFAPLGITDAAWTKCPAGVCHGAGELQLTPRDMAKFGYLYLRRGKWGEQQIVPAEWVANSIVEHTSYMADFGYGYQWWTLNALGAGMAVGFAGQYIWYFPGLDLVAVITGGGTDDVNLIHRFLPMLSGLLKLKISDRPLPENPEALASLQAVIKSATDPEPSPVRALPDTVNRISGRNYSLLSKNLLTVPGHVQFRVPAGMGVDAWETQALKLTFKDQEATLTLTFVDNKLITIPIGLNGRCCTARGRLGLVASKGEWVTDNLFRLYLQHVGDCTRYHIDMSFTNRLLEIVAFEIAGGTANVVFGLEAE